MSRRKSLGQQIADLYDPTPKEFVPEDDDVNEPAVDEDIGEIDYGSNENSLHLRADISLTSGKYKGVPTTRKSFGYEPKEEDDEEMEEDKNEEGDTSDEDGDSGDSSESGEEFSDDIEFDRDNPFGSVDITSALSKINNAVYKQAEELEAKATENAGKGIKLVSDTRKELVKAKHTQNQQKIWDSFLKLRIKQQRAYTISNRLPQVDMMDAFCTAKPEIATLRTESSNYIQEFLNTLLILGYEIQSQNPATQKYMPEKVQELYSVDDSRSSRKRKRDFFTCTDDDPTDFYWNMINEYNNAPTEYYRDTFDFWQRRTQLASRISQTQFKAINQSIITQVENAMATPEKLIERGQHLRSTTGKILGKPVASTTTEQDNGVTAEDKFNDPEIFDDSIFYQQLLKSLIEQDSTMDATEQTRSWLKSKDQNKKRKVYDSKQNKDRVVKFNVHEKLVDFMTPIDKDLPAFASDLFSNLFK